jgi:D-alanyl-D-alanine carboxypeptidase
MSLRPFTFSQYLFGFGFCALIFTAGYFAALSYRVSTDRGSLAAENAILKDLLASTSETYALERTAASSSLAELTRERERLTEELENTEDDLRDERNRNKKFADQIEEISGTVGVLDKLAKTDKELLQKYSKVYFLNENYVPSNIKEIDSKYILPGRKSQSFHGDALPFLEDMLDEAAADGVNLNVVSGYRSFDEQMQLKGAYTQTYGSGANTFSADQGYSEHQLGTTVDLSDPATNGPYLAFKNTKEYEWLLNNAHRYGFILSYPPDNAFYTYEPWHWRFVGVDLARDLHRADAHFYDWDQRKIDTYLVSIFD